MDFLVLQTPTTHAQSLATWLRLSLLLDKRWGAGHALHSEQVWRETGTCLPAPHANGGEERKSSAPRAGGTRRRIPCSRRSTPVAPAYQRGGARHIGESTYLAEWSTPVFAGVGWLC